MKKAILLLENGRKFFGTGHGKNGISTGELVFTTANPGYAKSITDPSFAGQILVFAYPLIGNYGANPDWGESSKVNTFGIVVGELSEKYFHREAEGFFEEYLEKEEIGCISQVDTREIVKIIRNEGCLRSALAVYEEENEKEVLNSLENIFDHEEKVDYVKKMSTKEIQIYNPHGTKTVALIDYGLKTGIVDELIKRDAKVVVFPPYTSAEVVLSYDPQGIMLSNGPGDPEEVTYAHPVVKSLMETNIPIFGICLGHQIISIASGAKTYKLKFGHRGANQPAQDLETKKAYMTSQNHGYAVDDKSLSDEWKVLFKNLNDDTVEGLKHKTKPIFSVQFHPEACPGPWDTSYLFDDFLKMIK